MSALGTTLPYLDRRLPSAARAVLSLFAALRGGSLALRLPDDVRLLVGEGPCVARVTVSDWAVFERVIAKGSIGLAEEYLAGGWEVDHLAEFLTLMVQNRQTMARAIHGDALRLIGCKLWHALRANTRAGARRNIEAHYDLGNEFYALWLDETMSYSAACFETPAQSLADAQRAKYRRALVEAGATPGMRILEIGCGWGGLAEVAALEFGCEVVGVTLSPAQLAFARERAVRGGYSAAVSFALCDYRDLRGQFDAIVSLEMYEAVGERYWPVYFRSLSQLLRAGGRALVQGITIADELFDHYRRHPDFIQRYVFPGGMLASPSVFAEQVKRAGLRIETDFAFGGDYARTLSHWHQRFEAALPNVRALGFDARFVRLWRYYLAYCEAGFRAGSIDVHQFALARAAS